MLKILIKIPRQLDLEPKEKRSAFFKGKTIVVCSALNLALHLVNAFVYFDLLRRVNTKKNAAEFPLELSGPFRNNDGIMYELLDLQPSRFRETWIVIGNSRFQEFYDFLINKYPEHKREVEVKDMR